MNASDQPPGETIRALMRRAKQASLATNLARGGTVWPYGSLVLVALDHDASPLLLISELAEHTKNILRDPHVTLLFDGTAGWREPLAGPRATVLGRAAPAGSDRLLARFVARHPGAAAYAGFKDFQLYRVAPESAHLVAGFGQIEWVEAGALRYDCADASSLAEAEPGIVAHMNQDHGEALQLIAGRILGLAGDGWTLAGLDPEGCDLRRGTELARLPFDTPVKDAEGARTELVGLVKRARAAA